jgi:hypothetical protein
MSPRAIGLLRTARKVLAILVIGFPAVWGVIALWYQVPGGQAVKALGVVLWSAFCIAMLVLVCQGRGVVGVLGFSAGFALLLLWWDHLPASNDREWSDDVAQLAAGSVQGNHVVLHNVRNFDWRSLTDYTQRWETRDYDLDHLRSVDMILSYWSGMAIAHMLVSFGFDDGEHVAFSVEIRREKGEKFSEIGGFFKQFELSVIAADERDVIRLRTNIRGEDDYLYAVQMPTAEMRSLFLAYVDEANSLVQKPRYYNTVTANCTTLVYHMMKRIMGHLPLSYRLLLTGYLPGYVYAVGGLDRRYPLDELRARGRITERARQSDRSPTFSADIRRGVPGSEP